MGKQSKAKTGQTRNDARKNGKASKNPDAPRNSKNPQTAIQQVLLGKGLYKKISDRAAKDKPRAGAPRRRAKDSDD